MNQPETGTSLDSTSGKRRRTRQRDAVLRAMREFDHHPDVRTVYERVKAEMPSISLATVYRNLDVLAAQGEISEVRIGSGQVLFDNNVSRHGHLICRACGSITDIDIVQFEGRIRRSFVESGFQDMAVAIDVYGTCPECGQCTESRDA